MVLRLPSTARLEDADSDICVGESDHEAKPAMPAIGYDFLKDEEDKDSVCNESSGSDSSSSSGDKTPEGKASDPDAAASSAHSVVVAGDSDGDTLVWFIKMPSIRICSSSHALS